MADFLIYGLRCPETGFYKYIGKSSNGLSRPKSHLTLSHNNSIRLWVEELRDKGLCPLIDIIEECDSVQLLEREKYWISYYHNSVYPLMNIIEYKGINIEKLREELKAEEQILMHKINAVKEDIENLSNIYKFIKTIRKKRGVTQELLASLSGVGLRTIKQIETGKSNPTFKTLENALDVLGYKLVPILKNS
jgi:DNA-binding XRE family transcriptional regulator